MAFFREAVTFFLFHIKFNQWFSGSARIIPLSVFFWINYLKMRPTSLLRRDSQVIVLSFLIIKLRISFLPLVNVFLQSRLAQWFISVKLLKETVCIMSCDTKHPDEKEKKEFIQSVRYFNLKISSNCLYCISQWELLNKWSMLDFLFIYKWKCVNWISAIFLKELFRKCCLLQ